MLSIRRCLNTCSKSNSIVSISPSSSCRRHCSSDRLHSTDIAFKPSESGWGYNRKYINTYDTIFKKKDNTKGVDDKQETSPITVTDKDIPSKVKKLYTSIDKLDDTSKQQLFELLKRNYKL